MVKKRKQKKDAEVQPGFFEELSTEARHGALALFFLALTLFFVLSPFGFAGVVGDKIYGWLYSMFGVGYFMIPILFLLLSATLLKDDKPRLAGRTSVGSFLFFISGLGLIGIVAGKDASGFFGDLIASPMMSLFGGFMGFIFLLVFAIISLFVIFNARPKKETFLFWKSNSSDETVDKNSKIKVNGVALDQISSDKSSSDTDNKESSPSLKPAFLSSKKNKKIDPKEEDTSDKLKDMFGLGKNPAQSFLDNYVGDIEFAPPPLTILAKDNGKPDAGDVKANANIIRRTLQNFGINVEMDEVSVGPSVTRYALKPAEGVKLSRIVGLQNDLSLALAAHPIRIEAPIPGKSLVGIEIPNSSKTMVGLGSLLKKEAYQQSLKPLLVALGKDISGNAFFGDLAKMPHLLIAGTTGSGKSVTVHALITSMLFRNPPESLQFIMVDPKRVELTFYNGIPHLLTKVITDSKKAIKSLHWAIKEMERRYDVLETEKVRDIGSYHKNVYQPAIKKHEKDRKKVKVVVDGEDVLPEEQSKLPERMPYIVIVIDELADIMTSYPREMEAGIVRLAQMSRAVGIHLILSTQRPSVNVITGLIKANIPGRIALKVASQIDSRTILDTGGAEKLLGAGDMLYLSGDMSKPTRIQSAFITENEIKKIVKHLTDEYRDHLPNEIDLEQSDNENVVFGSDLGGSFDKEDEDEEMYNLARQTVIESGKASTSFLQRRLKLGYSRAARIVDLLEENGVIGPQNGSKPRDVYDLTPEESSDVPEEGGEDTLETTEYEK